MTLRALTIIFAALALVACGDISEPVPSADAAGAPASSEEAGASASREDAAARSIEVAGRRYFSICGACHSVRAGDNARRIGPSLHGVYGRPAAALEGFAYSKAMRQSGVVWTQDALDAYVANPQKFMRGNRMAYRGERNAEKRAAIIAYLKSLN